MKKVKYKVGIIGCGMIFQRHIESIESNSKDFRLVAVCDINKVKINGLVKKYGVAGFTDYKIMLEKMKKDMNFVSILTPNSFHYEQAVNSLKMDYDVLVEKPVDFSYKKILRISKTAEINKKKAYAVLQVRYNPTVQLVKKAVSQNLFGSVRAVSLIQRWQRPPSYFDSWRADILIGGRVLYEVGIHYLDILQYIFGLPKIKSASTFNNKHKKINFEDTVYAIIQFPNGASGSIEVTVAAEPANLECSLAVLCEEGYIKIGGRALDQIEDIKFMTDKLQKKWQKLKKMYGKSLQPNSYGPYQGSCPNHPTLYKNIAKGKGIPILETINSVKLIEDIYEKTA